MSRLCECGCGGIPNPGNRFIRNHHARLPENRKKISSALSGTRLGEANPFWGKTHSESTKLGWKVTRPKGIPRTEEIKRKISEAMKGRPLTEDHRIASRNATILAMQNPDVRKKISDKAKGRPAPNKGISHSPETIDKIRNSKQGQSSMEKNPNWRGGLSFESYGLGWTDEFKKMIKDRDYDKCQNPRCQNGSTVKTVHHIDYDKQNLDPGNLITLCRSCHVKSNYNRKYWTRYYQSVMKRKELKQATPVDGNWYEKKGV